MATSSLCERKLLLLPCEPKDYNTGRCRLGVKVMESLGLIVGSTVKISLPTRDILCTAWPIKGSSQQYIQIDPLVCFSSTGKDFADIYNVNILVCTNDINLIEPQTAKSVTATVWISGEGEFQNVLGKTLQLQMRGRQAMLLLENQTICKGCVIHVRKSKKDVLKFINDVRKITIEGIEPCDNDTPLLLVTSQTQIIVNRIRYQNNDVEIFNESVAGLDQAYKQLKELLSYPFLYPKTLAHLGVECPKGVLLHGVPGVGKTLLVRTIVAECDAQLVTLNGPEVFGPHSGESEENLRKTFEKARLAAKNGPCVLFIDEIDALCPRRVSSGGDQENRIVAQLLTLMDGMEGRGSLVVIGATNRPNSLDPALRRPGRFDQEIVINTPSAYQRLEILKAHTANYHLSDDVDLALLADKTLGYVGADLALLCREAVFLTMKKDPNISSMKCKASRTGNGSKQACMITMTEFNTAMCHIVPSTYRGMEGLVDHKPVLWEAIGGLEETKIKLQQAVEWPLKYPEAFARMGLSRPRGILLYGPPGCCKTTLVRAAATACHCTFISLSCAQLYSPFVGDSERLIVEIFNKARSAAPSILFLDEIDAVVSKRSSSNQGGGMEARVLSTLLNEMDGVGVSANIYRSADETDKDGQRPCKDILVVAATNRPEALDEALTRPGRIDSIVYVPPPDELSRLAILKVYATKCPIHEDVDLNYLAENTDMYSGADLENLCREAALHALEGDGILTPFIHQKHFLLALEQLKPSLNSSMLSKYKLHIK